MSRRWAAWPYQKFSVRHAMAHPEAGLFLGMGLGKTVIVLTAIDWLLHRDREVRKVLVIAPIRVARDTWTNEAAEWDHTKHLTFAKVLGTEAQRKKALREEADIYLINVENVPWLVGHFGLNWPFDMVVFDELSCFKSSKSERWKAMRMVRPKIKRVIGLTGTPTSTGLLDLWPQIYLLDMGERLGKSIVKFREQYFRKENDYTAFSKYEIRTDEGDAPGESRYAKIIYEKIGDICISMKAEDYLTLPKRIDRDRTFMLSGAAQAQYDKFERDSVLEMLGQADHDEEGAPVITAVNAAVLSGKLLQFANGAVYRADKTYYEVHDEKIDVLHDDLEAANGSPYILFYQFQHDCRRIEHKLRHFKPEMIGATKDWLRRWNAGDIPFLMAHPRSAAHGLNMQHGGHLVGWFGPTWSHELNEQGIARVDRQGQKEAVINSRYLAEGTLDMHVVDVLEGRKDGDNALMKALRPIIEKYT